MTPSLFELPVLIVDCQTTGASPRTGHLLDLGWCVTRAADSPVAPEAVTHHLARLPEGAVVPRPVTRLTGITTAGTRAGLRRDRLWRDLGAAAAALRNGEGPFCVAHYARFEEGFLRALHAECAPGDPFPLRFLCTHEISRRLFPDLPRRSLRAVAGLLGPAAPELKRARAHVAATAGVWAELVRRLRDDHGVETLDGLRRLLAAPPPRRGARWEYPLPREKRLNLPDRPGVYRFQSRDGTVLYVGRARSLKARVNSYYRKRRAEDKILELVSQACDVNVTVTASGLEAALLEAAEIQRLDPCYNHALRGADPRVWFLAPDFVSARSRPDGGHRRGPIPDRRPFAVVRALGPVLRDRRAGTAAETTLAEALELPGLRLRHGVLAAGATVLAERHGVLPEACGPGALLALGRRLARERAEAMATRRAGGDELAAIDAATAHGGDVGRIPGGLFDRGEADRARGPTPEGVADWLEGTLIYASRLTRRARWFSVLAHSTLCWRPVSPGVGPRRALVLEGGVLSPAFDLPRGGAPPLPSRSRCARQASFRVIDRACYDRLRVLTTEVKRLLAEGRDADLYLAPGRRLGTRRLRHVLEDI